MGKSRNHELMKNTLILSIGQIVPKLIALFVLPILTTFLTKREYGLYELSLSVASFCIPVISVQIQQAVFRFLIDKDSNRNAIITGSFFFVIIGFGITAIPVIIAWVIYAESFWLAFVFFCAYFCEMLLSLAGQTARGLGKNLTYSLAYVIYSVLFILGLVIKLNITGKLGVKDVTIIMAGSYFISFLYIFLSRKIYKYVDYESMDYTIIKMLLTYSAPMVISSISLWVVNLSDRFLVTAYLGLEATAMYAAANKIPNLFNSMYNIFNLAWTENTSKLTGEEKHNGYYSGFFKEFYQLMVGLMLVLICTTPLLFKFLINDSYIGSYSLMSWLYVGAFFSSLVAFFGSIYVGEKRTKDVGISSAIGAIINVIINIIFMRYFGVIIAAVSTIVSYFAILIYRAVDVKKYVTIKYDLPGIITGLLFVCTLAGLNYTYCMWCSVASLILTIIYNVFFNRKIFGRLVKKIVSKK